MSIARSDSGQWLISSPKTWILLPLVVCLLRTPVAAEAAIVRMRAFARAGSAVVSLGDVAEVYDVDPDLVRRLQAVTLAPAPPSASELRLGHDQVRDRLQAHGFSLADIEFSGSNSVRVSGTLRSSTSSVPHYRPPGSKPRATADAAALRQRTARAEQVVAAAVQRFVQAQAPAAGEFLVDVQVPVESVDALLIAADAGCEVIDCQMVWHVPQPVRLRCQDARGSALNLQVACCITPLPPDFTANQVEKGNAVGAGHSPGSHITQSSHERPVTITRSSAQQPTSNRAGTGSDRRTLSPTSGGSLIRAQDLRLAPLVRSGDLVSLQSQRGGITVRRMMKARTEGREGDVITLVAPDGREAISARVTGYRTAEVVVTGDAAAAGASRRGIEADPQPAIGR